MFGLLCACTVSAQKKTDLEIEGLKGRVRSVRVEWARLTVEGGKLVASPRRPQRLTIYDEQGNKTESMIFKHDGSILTKSVYGKDAQGNLVTASFDGNGKLIRRTVMMLNAQEQFPDVFVFGPNGEPLERSVRTRRADGRLTEEAIYDANGALLYKNVFSHDDQGKQTEFANYNSAGKLTQKTVWLNDGGIHSIKYDERGNLWYESIHRASTIEDIDPQGNWTERHTPEKTTQEGHTREYVGVTYRAIEYHTAKKP